MPKEPKLTKAEKEEKQRKEAEAKRLEAEQKIDQEVQLRTAKFDQELKIQARKLGINPDNFATEEELAQAIKKVEEENEQ